MRIAIYSPYLDTAGGGEKYILTIAEVLSRENPDCKVAGFPTSDEVRLREDTPIVRSWIDSSKENSVDVLLDEHLIQVGIEIIKSKIERLHGLDLSKVNFIKAPIGQDSNFLSRILFLRKYDWLFYLTDGSIFFSSAQNSVVHFQVPFEDAPKNMWGKFKLQSWKLAIYNSEFTKSYVEKAWNIKGEVIYPPVSVDLFKPTAKKNQILSVGRFFGFLKDKKHQYLIESFKELVKDKNLSNWSLHLAGGAGEGDMTYIEDLKNLAKGFDIFFYPNANLTEIASLYGQSKIYWHASGYGEDDPKKFEHFGITVVEAMAAECVPVVINKGGLKEIVENEQTGFLWDNQQQMLELTLKVISDKDLWEKICDRGRKRALDFSKENFETKIKKVVYG